MKLLTPMGFSRLETIWDEKSGEKQEQLGHSPLLPNSVSTGEETENQSEESPCSGTEHARGREGVHQRRPLSLPPTTSVQRAKAVFKRTSLGFFKTSTEPISSGIVGDGDGALKADQNANSDVAQDGSMDRRRPAIGGPRAPIPPHGEDQRNQAFESIFGAPSAAHRDYQQRPAQRALPPNVHQQPQYSPVYHQQPNQPRLLQPQYPQTYSRSPQQYAYPQQNYSRPGSGYSPSSDSLGYYSNSAVPSPQSYQPPMASNQQRLSSIPPGAQHLPQQMYNSNHSIPPRIDSLVPEDGGKLSLDFMSENGHAAPVNSTGIVIQGPEDEEEDDSELPWIKAGQRTPTTNLPGGRGSVQALPPPSSTGSTTPPSSTDYHDHKSSGPPRLNLDFSTHSSFSVDHNSDPSTSGRTSVDSARATPPMTLPLLNTHATSPSPQPSSASSSIARRSLPPENRATRAPLSQLNFTQSSINTSSTSISGSSNVPGTPVSQTSTAVGRRVPKRAPLVYPALLSRVADALLRRLPLAVRVKDGLSYPEAFDGREAVDKICYIIKTTDRSLALLLGRALDAQKFFHDVTYDHRLRDNPSEIYQFRSRRSGLGLTTGEPGGMGHVRGDSLTGHSLSHRPSASKASTIDAYNGYGENPRYAGSDITLRGSGTPHDDHIPTEAENLGVDEVELPTGVFTMLTECYSATCTRDQLCYSITCPRRMEQQHRINLQQRPGSAGGRTSSNSVTTRVGRRATIGNAPGDTGSGPTSPVGSISGHGHGLSPPPQATGMSGVPRMRKNADGEAVGVADDDDDHQEESGQLWIHSVPKEVADALSDQEKKRQEAINEVIYTERDFVRDMEYLRDVWVAGIRNSDVIPIERRDAFISQVFWNILAIIDVNTRLRDLLSKRQKQFIVVGEVGDIFKEIVPMFDPFVDYGAHQMYGKYEFEKEKGNNPAFAAFVEELERLPESRKLELNGYLTKPTTRLARYPLLLEAVLKHTPESSPDKVNLQEVIVTVREFLSKVNQKTGEAENRFHLHQLERQLAFRQGEYVDLRLSAENRKMVYKGSLNRRGGAGDKEDLQVFLFDHALLMVKQKTKADQYKVYRRPIPLELLIVSAADEPGSTPTLRPSTTGRVGGKAALVKPSPQHEHHTIGNAGHNGHSSHLSLTSNGLSSGTKNGFPITFTHLGWRGYTITLWASTFISKKKWLEHIQKQQDMMHERSRVFELVPFSEGVFIGGNRANCAAPFNDGVRIAYGTDDGVYFSDFREPNRPPVKMLALLDVTQVDILHESQELIVLAAGTVFTFPLEVLDAIDPTAALKRGKRIATHTSFFKAGVCNRSFIVCVVKTTALSTTVKTFEPIDQSVRGKSKPTFKKLLQGGNDTLKLFKEFYIPVESYSLTILQSRLCIGCARGFQIVDLATLDTQQLVDPADPSLEFIDKKDNLRPLAIFRVDADFLLCYDEWAVFVDKRGSRARGDWRANWEGRPTAFAFHYPYVIAIEPAFVEVWDVITCTIKQVIPGEGLRCLFAEPPPKGSMYPPNPHHPYPSNGMGQPGAMMGMGAYPPRGSSAQHLPPNIPPHLMYSGRSSLQGPGMPASGPYGPILQPHVPGAPFFGGPGSGRREIVIASDDSVMFLKLAPPPTVAPQAASNGVAAHGLSDARQLPTR